MVPHALAALYGAEIPHQTITPAAHSSHAAAFEPSEHAASMHWGVIPSILDGGESSRGAGGKRETAGNVSRRSRIVRFGQTDGLHHSDIEHVRQLRQRQSRRADDGGD